VRVFPADFPSSGQEISFFLSVSERVRNGDPDRSFSRGRFVLPKRLGRVRLGFLRGGCTSFENVGGFIGPGRGVDKGDEVPLALLHDAAEWGLRPATRIKTALLHVMIAVMGVTQGAFAGNAKCVVAYVDVHTVDIKNRTGLSHYVWNPRHVCECDPSICCNVPRLDSQRDCAAMTHVVRTRPVGKCPDTAASRRKMP